MAILQRVGAGNVDSNEERMLNQKSVYLLSELGMTNLLYGFSWYIHGPYCSELTNEVYQSRNIDTDGAVFSDKEEEIIKKFLDMKLELSKLKPASAPICEKLELAASLVYLYNYLEKRTKFETVRHIKHLRPAWKRWPVKQYLDVVDRYGLLRNNP
jgi:uncharacterized protein YwgA